jgi:hypothetical protein
MAKIILVASSKNGRVSWRTGALADEGATAILAV